MKKQFCDYCKKEISFELCDEISIYNHAKEDDEYKKDICEGCKKNILKKLKEVEND